MECCKEIKVSIIMPSLNVASYIEQCISSAINQTLKDIEIICVDAGSTDGTLDILKHFADKDSRIKIIHSEEKSYGRQINIGIDNARGEYIAILETDDWIEPGMCQALYRNAVKYELDYSGADFDKVYTLRNGGYYYERERLFCDKEMYGKVLNRQDINKLRASDYVLWKSIYKRAFINEYNIRLHESPKAAFQDMGFLQQVKTYADRAMYIDESFYRYRQGRPEASSCNINGLMFYKNEFEWINEELGLTKHLSETQKVYYYYTMSIAFLTKYQEILQKNGFNSDMEELKEPYNWFLSQLKGMLENGFLCKEIYMGQQFEDLKELINSCEIFAGNEKAKYNLKKNNHKEIIEKIGHRNVIIYGCGIRGKRLLRFCDMYNIPVIAFLDGNKEKTGERISGYPVMNPTDALDLMRNSDNIVDVSVKNGKEDIYKLLKDMNITSCVIDMVPDEL